ncbi:hypothetical protein [Streptomyces sp. NPDC005799]|uniref:hypothetical protein n=1 Tax=Streptomyces sp. NPDC005799 TaxID=3154678 RepID=UPI0033E214A4
MNRPIARYASPTQLKAFAALRGDANLGSRFIDASRLAGTVGWWPLPCQRQGHGPAHYRDCGQAPMLRLIAVARTLREKKSTYGLLCLLGEGRAILITWSLNGHGELDALRAFRPDLTMN